MKSALEKAQIERFDLLISDVGLPDGSGMELMAKLSAKTRLLGIAMSGFGTNADIQKSLEAGFSQHLVKPVTMERLDAAINRIGLMRHLARDQKSEVRSQTNVEIRERLGSSLNSLTLRTRQSPAVISYLLIVKGLGFTFAQVETRSLPTLTHCFPRSCASPARTLLCRFSRSLYSPRSRRT